MNHYKVEVLFEAWDNEDAERMVRRLADTLRSERRLIFVGIPEEHGEYLDPAKPPVRDPRERV